VDEGEVGRRPRIDERDADERRAAPVHVGEIEAGVGGPVVRPPVLGVEIEVHVDADAGAVERRRPAVPYWRWGIGSKSSLSSHSHQMARRLAWQEGQK